MHFLAGDHNATGEIAINLMWILRMLAALAAAKARTSSPRRKQRWLLARTAAEPERRRAAGWRTASAERPMPRAEA